MKINYWVLTLALSFICSNFAYATCEQDMYQMYSQIAKFGTITSIDGHRFAKISSLSEQEHTCTAQAYKTDSHKEYIYVCPVRWEKGNWGNTLACH